MCNSFNIELYKDNVIINSLHITLDFFKWDVPIIKEELRGAYLMMYNDIPRKDFFLPNFQGWDTLIVVLTNDDVEIKRQEVSRTNFDSDVSASSLQDVLYGLYILLTGE
jgi:hypothetical protein